MFLMMDIIIMLLEKIMKYACIMYWINKNI